MRHLAWLLFFLTVASPALHAQNATPRPAAHAQSAAMECFCRAQGRMFAEGEMVCLKTAQGNRMARCEMITNVMSWGVTETPCPQS